MWSFDGETPKRGNNERLNSARERADRNASCLAKLERSKVGSDPLELHADGLPMVEDDGRLLRETQAPSVALGERDASERKRPRWTCSCG